MKRCSRPLTVGRLGDAMQKPLAVLHVFRGADATGRKCPFTDDDAHTLLKVRLHHVARTSPELVQARRGEEDQRC